jgi:hypothetical protein
MRHSRRVSTSRAELSAALHAHGLSLFRERNGRLNAAIAANQSPLRTLAHILHAASIVGSGAWDQSDDAKANRENASESALVSDLHALFTLLRERKVSYLLVGGVAMLRYIDGRNTDDIDLIIAVEDAARMPDVVIENQQDEPARARFRNVRVDFLFTSNAIFRLAKDRYAMTHQFAEVQVPCATAEGLVLLKLYALPSLYRQGDLQRAALYETDITMLCQRHQPRIAPLMDAVQPHIAAGEFQELQRIVSEIEQRLRRMQER